MKIPEPHTKEDSKNQNKESKIEALLDFAHLEELFHLLNILDQEEIELFLRHYKKSRISETKDKKINQVIKSSKDSAQLVENVRTELINAAKNEMSKLNYRISALREKGEDTCVEEIKIYPAALKMKMFGVTSKKEDFYKIKKIISIVEESVKIKEEKLQKNSGDQK